MPQANIHCVAVMVCLSALVAGCAFTEFPYKDSDGGIVRALPANEVSVSRVRVEIEGGQTVISGQVRILRNSRSIYSSHIDLRWEMPDGSAVERSNVRFERISRSPNRNTRAWFHTALNLPPPRGATMQLIYHKDPHTPDLEPQQ